MGGKPLVSVIIPAYNRAEYVGASIESVLNQSWPEREVIVVDDGSTDETADVVARYPSVRYIHQSQCGIGAARNRGVRSARGEFLAFLDSDDLWTGEKLAIQMRAADENPGVDIFYGYAKQFVSPGVGGADRQTMRFIGNPMAGYLPGTLLVSARTFARVGLFPETWKVGEAMEWHLRAVEMGLRIMLLPDVVLLRRLHSTNQGRVHRDARRDYVRILKAALDRRRTSSSVAENQPDARSTGECT